MNSESAARNGYSFSARLGLVCGSLDARASSRGESARENHTGNQSAAGSLDLRTHGAYTSGRSHVENVNEIKDAGVDRRNLPLRPHFPIFPASDAPGKVRSLGGRHGARPAYGYAANLKSIVSGAPVPRARLAQAFLPRIDRCKRCSADEHHGCDQRHAKRPCHAKEKVFQDLCLVSVVRAATRTSQHDATPFRGEVPSRTCRNAP